MRRLPAIVAVMMIAVLLSFGCSKPIHVYPKIEKAKKLSFPRDHYAHREFRTEWWYYSGHLDGEDGSRYGFELVFFVRRTDNDIHAKIFPASAFSNPAHLAHFGIIDLQKGTFNFAEKRTMDYIDRGKNAGALEDSFYVWNEDWSAKGMGGFQYISANMKGYDLSLGLRSEKPFVLHGDDGFFLKADGPDFNRGTYYISYTRLVGDGFLFIEGKPKKVKAQAWMDHEFGSRQLAPDQLGWDWISLQFEDNSELMIYLLKQENGSWGPYSKGTYVAADGTYTTLPLDAFRITPLRTWTSEKSGAVYTVDWHVRALPLDLDVKVTALMDGVEINSKKSTKTIYWEGAVDAKGTKGGSPIKGRGYMEICGSSHPMIYLTEENVDIKIPGS